ncbi:hypothetical protein C0991_012433, partial [Blastosporella zonata]
KNIHAYVPNRMGGGKPKVSSDTKKSWRHNPYKRNEVVDTSYPSTEGLNTSPYPGFGTADVVDCSELQGSAFSYTWDKIILPKAALNSDTLTSPTSSPFGPSSALDTSPQLYNDIDIPFDIMDLLTLQQYPQTVCPTENYLPGPVVACSVATYPEWSESASPAFYSSPSPFSHASYFSDSSSGSSSPFFFESSNAHLQSC